MKMNKLTMVFTLVAVLSANMLSFVAGTIVYDKSHAQQTENEEVTTEVVENNIDNQVEPIIEESSVNHEFSSVLGAEPINVEGYEYEEEEGTGEEYDPFTFQNVAVGETASKWLTVKNLAENKTLHVYNIYFVGEDADAYSVSPTVFTLKNQFEEGAFEVKFTPKRRGHHVANIQFEINTDFDSNDLLIGLLVDEEEDYNWDE